MNNTKYIPHSEIIKARYRSVVGIVSFQVRMRTKDGRRALAKEKFEFDRKYGDHEVCSLPFICHFSSYVKCYGVINETCFKSETSTPDFLYAMFTQMITDFEWYDVKDLINRHSLFGAAYINACCRASKKGRFEINNTCDKITIPQKDMVLEEFRKIILRCMCNDFFIDEEIYSKYVKIN